MNLEEYRQYYLHLGGTNKRNGGETIGCFGAAKELLSFAWDTWQCSGQGFTVTGQGAADPKSDSSPGAGIRKGFLVGATDESLDHIALYGSLSDIAKLSKLQLRIDCDYLGFGKETIAQGRTLRKSQLIGTYDWGNLYVIKSGYKSNESTGYLYIRSKGLYTAHSYIGGDYVFYVDISAPSPDVLSQNRDSLRSEVRRRIEQDLQALSRNPGRIERKPQQSHIMLYGAVLDNIAAEAYTPEVGLMAIGIGQSSSKGIDSQANTLWHSPFALVGTKSRAAKAINDEGQLRPSVAKALEVWRLVLNLIADSVGVHRPIPGLYYGKDAGALCCKISEEQHVIAADKATVLKQSAYYVLQLAIHELAHYLRSGHSQEYENGRMGISRDIGEVATAIVENIRLAQSAKQRKGRYWEQEQG